MYNFRIIPTALVKRDHTRRFDISGTVRKPTAFLLDVIENDSVIASRKFSLEGSFDDAPLDCRGLARPSRARHQRGIQDISVFRRVFCLKSGSK